MKKHANTQIGLRGIGWSLCLIIVAIAVMATKCEGEIMGSILVTIVDESENTPLEGARVEFHLAGGRTDIVSTNIRGIGETGWVGPGAMDIKIIISREGYQGKEIIAKKDQFIIDAAGNATYRITITLMPLN